MNAWVDDAIRSARVARLGTVDRHGDARLVPICFAVVGGFVVSAVDHKPKRHERLARLDDIEAIGRATVLIDHYDEDWSYLWWVRIRGAADVRRDGDPAAVAELQRKYTQYREHPPVGPVYRIAMDDVTSWRATAR